MSQTTDTNAIAFIGLCSEYCAAMEGARESTRDEFIAAMVRLLPRLYISASDLRTAPSLDEEFYIDSVLEEDYYEAVRRAVENLMGPDDTFLEVFEEDMKYSDTPIAASVSECLADIFQVVYNFVETIRNAPDEIVAEALTAVADDFGGYWSQIICNVMRPLNHLRHNAPDED